MHEGGHAINLSHFASEFFRNAIRAHVVEYAGYYEGRLAAIYIRGSVHRNEAIPGISDLDIIPFIWDEFTEDDRSYWSSVRDKLEPKYPGTKLGWACPVGTMRTVEPLHSELKHDATLVFGTDMVAELDPPMPDYFQGVWQLAQFLSGVDGGDRSHSSIPAAPERKLRKLSRLTIMAAAGLLLAQEDLRSYQAAHVLPKALEHCPGFRELLNEAGRHHDTIAPTTAEAVDDFQARFLAFTAWVGAHRARLHDFRVPKAVEDLSNNPSQARMVIEAVPEDLVKLPGRN